MKIKKMLIIFAFILIAIIIAPNVVNATVGDTFIVDEITYTVLTEEEGNNTIEVSSYNRANSPVNLVLDPTVENNGITYSVIAIGEYAFQFCTSLESIEIPNSVKSIEMLSFANCTSLKNIKIPNSVRKIGNSAFSSCTSLEYIEIPNSVKTIEQSAFGYCTSLKSIKIPNSVTSIEYFTFGSCTSLENVEIPNSIKTIGQAAFHTCTALQTLKIPESVTSIGDYVFFNCSFNIAIPKSVTSIGENSIPTGNNTTIYGSESSYAKQFAINNGNNFEKLAHSVTTRLTGIVSDGVSYVHTDLGNYVTTLIPNAGYKLPETIIVKSSGAEISDYSYNKLTGKVVVESAAIIGDIEIIADGIVVKNSVVNNLTNMTSNGDDYVYASQGNYKATLTANGEYRLPKNIKVKVDGVKIEEYTYNNVSGEVVIESPAITGDIEIIGTAVAIPKYTVTIQHTEGLTITTNDTLVNVLEGANVDIKIKEEEGYIITSIKVNGVEQKIPLNNDILTIKDINEDINVVVDVEKEKVEDKTHISNNEGANNNTGNTSTDNTNTGTNNNHTETKNNPQTGDNIIIFVVTLIIATIGIITTTKVKKYIKE